MERVVRRTRKEGRLDTMMAEAAEGDISLSLAWGEQDCMWGY